MKVFSVTDFFFVGNKMLVGKIKRRKFKKTYHGMNGAAIIRFERQMFVFVVVIVRCVIIFFSVMFLEKFNERNCVIYFFVIEKMVK